MLNNLWLDMDVATAIDIPRMHHQLLPPNITYEADVPEVQYYSIG